MNPRGEGDDFTLEVSDLRTGRLLASPLSRQPPSSDASAPAETMLSDADADADADDALTITSLDSNAPIVPRRPTRIFASRRSRSLAVIGLSLLICIAILLSAPAARQRLGQALQGSTPTPPPAIEPGGDTFYLVNGVPWGSITADGKPVNFSGALNEAPSFILDRGRHQVQYVAAPFPTLRCTVSVPADTARDTCLLTTNYQFGDNMGDARVIDLGLSPDKLPPDQFAALVRVIAIALEQDVPSTTVRPGDHYLDANGKPAVAPKTLHATLSLTLNIDPSRPLTNVPSPSGGGSCVTLCAAGLSGPNGWDFFAHVVAQWHFVARDGTVASASGPTADTWFELSVSWLNSAWLLDTVMSQSGQLGNLCWDAFSAASGGPLVPSSVSNYETGASAPNAADGCADVISSSNDVSSSPGNPSATPTPLPPDAALFLYRFGLVLAGNPLAHKAQPQLPLATAHEQVLALEWLQTPS